MREGGRFQWTRLPVAHRWQRPWATIGPASAPAIALLEPATLGRPAITLNRTAARHGWMGRRDGPDDLPGADLEGLVELASSLGAEPDGMATYRLQRRGRRVVGLARGGELRLVVKLGPGDDQGLRHEAEVLERLGGVRFEHFEVPALRWAGAWQGSFAVVTAAVAGRRVGYDVGPERAVDLCTSLAGSRLGPLVHSDLAPWNVLRSPRGLTLIDWEAARAGDEPLRDLAHYVVQRAWLLRRSTPAGAVADLTAPRSPGWRLLEARGLDPRRAPALLVSYLRGAPERSRFHQAMLDLLGPT